MKWKQHQLLAILVAMHGRNYHTYEWTSHSSSIKNLTRSSLWPIHLQWPPLEKLKILTPNYGVKSTRDNNYYQDIHVISWLSCWMIEVFSYAIISFLCFQGPSERERGREVVWPQFMPSIWSHISHGHVYVAFLLLWPREGCLST